MDAAVEMHGPNTHDEPSFPTNASAPSHVGRSQRWSELDSRKKSERASAARMRVAPPELAGDVRCFVNVEGVHPLMGQEPSAFALVPPGP